MPDCFLSNWSRPGKGITDTLENVTVIRLFGGSKSLFQLLLLSQVTFYYEKGKVVLNKVSLSANQESRIALVS